MLSTIVAFAMAVVIAALSIPIVRRVATDLGAVDVPRDRHAHARAVPRLGGIAIVLAFFLPLLILFGFETEVARRFFAEPMRMVGLVVGSLIVSGLGVLDDLRGVRAWHKLWLQCLAGVVAYACGFRIEAVTLPLVGHLDMGIFAVVVTTFWVVAIVNALNLVDGLDGLAGGVAFFACVTNFCVAAMHGDPLVALLSAALGGAVLGFLLFNFSPATIFMGDSGSMFLGYVLATTSIMGSSVKSSTTVAILVPLIALGLPLIDTLFAVVRRFLERRPVFSPDRGHIHHRLLAAGINHRRAVLILYGLSILFTTGAIAISIGRNWQVGTALLVLSLAVIGVTRAAGIFQVSLHRWRRRERPRPPSVERLRATVPDTLRRIHEADRPEDVARILVTFAEAAQLTSVELSKSRLERFPAFHWSVTPGEAPPLDREVISATFPLVAAGSDARVRFAWVADLGDAPESDILLQLVVDACDARLSRAATSQAKPAPRALVN
jgi:UDP-GlcNAc:undecaprenyl-phosphate GlcNAc-1-phosphate transferase